MRLPSTFPGFAAVVAVGFAADPDFVGFVVAVAPVGLDDLVAEPQHVLSRAAGGMEIRKKGAYHLRLIGGLSRHLI